MQILKLLLQSTSKLPHRALRMQEYIRNIGLSRIVLFAAGKRETAYCAHLIVAALFFSPFLLFGHTLYANSDLLLHNYPMLLLAKREFLSGSVGLWNTYAFSGTPQSVGAVTPILYPENWILFLVPEQHLFSVYTFVTFLKLWLVGVAAYHFYCAELLNRRWALFASLTYQLSGWMIWAVVSSVALSVYFYYTILLALLWTLSKRSALKNYLLLSPVLVMMLMPGNIAHASYALLGAGILFSYRVFSRRKVAPVIASLAIFAASVVTALLIFSTRLLPLLDTLSTGSRNICPPPCQSGFIDSSVLIARLFDTEIFGVSYYDSMTIFGAISPVLREFHIHSAMPAFFGVAAALLALWALLSEKSPKSVFWSVYTVVVLGLITAAKPFEEIALMLLGNISHPIGWQISLPVGFVALATYGGMSLEKNLKRGFVQRSGLQLFVFAVNVVVLFLMMITIRNIQKLWIIDPILVRISIVCLIMLGVLITLLRHRWPIQLRIVAVAVLWGLVVLGLYMILIFFDQNPTFTSHVKNLGISLIFFSGITITLLLYESGQLTSAWRLGLWGGTIAIVISIVVIIYPWTSELQLTISHGQNLFLAGIGFQRFVLGVSTFFVVLFAVRAKKLPARSIYVIFVLLLLTEQIPANKVHSHMNANPFNASSNPYPPMATPVGVDGKPVKLDLANYRVNFPLTMIQPPFYKVMYGEANEVCGAFNVAYRVRSYGGFNNTIPKKTIWFLQNWIPDAPGSFCIYAKHTDERFLDLTGVGYEYDRKARTVVTRPNARSRMMLFTQFEVIPNDQSVLNRLKTSDFKPLEKIVLQVNPGFNSRDSGQNGRKLKFNEINSDHIDIQVQTDGPALLFFGDSFAPGWIAEVGGMPQKVLEADYNFMAVPVPAGDSHVVLKYEPRSFTIGLVCAALGIALWLLAFAAHLLRRKPLVSNQKVAT